jgi:hypothetical protein
MIDVFKLKSENLKGRGHLGDQGLDRNLNIKINK